MTRVSTAPTLSLSLRSCQLQYLIIPQEKPLFVLTSRCLPSLSKLFLLFLPNSPRFGLSFFLSQLIKPKQLHSYRKPCRTPPLMNAVRREGRKKRYSEREKRDEARVKSYYHLLISPVCFIQFFVRKLHDVVCLGVKTSLDVYVRGFLNRP